MLNEPESWWLRKKKSLQKFNRRARRTCRRAVKSQTMFWLIIMLVFLNTCVLATEHYKQPPWLDYFQDVTNLFFVILFTLEMFMKMYALGLQVNLCLFPSKSPIYFFTPQILDGIAYASQVQENMCCTHYPIYISLVDIFRLAFQSVRLFCCGKQYCGARSHQK